MQYYVIHATGLWFSQVHRFPQTIKLTADKTEILWNIVLNNITVIHY